MLYRVLRPLSTGHVKGDLIEEGRFKATDALVAAGALAEVRPPPLSELPGWETRAEKLEKAGIVTAVDFLEADDEAIRDALGRKTTRGIAKWRDELRSWLVADEPKKRG